MNRPHEIEQDIRTLEASLEVLSRVAALPYARLTHVKLRNDLCAITSRLERSGKFVSVAMHCLQTQNFDLDASVAAVLDAVLLAINDADERAENAFKFLLAQPSEGAIARASVAAVCEELRRLKTAGQGGGP